MFSISPKEVEKFVDAMYEERMRRIRHRLSKPEAISSFKEIQPSEEKLSIPDFIATPSPAVEAARAAAKAKIMKQNRRRTISGFESDHSGLASKFDNDFEKDSLPRNDFQVLVPSVTANWRPQPKSRPKSAIDTLTSIGSNNLPLEPLDTVPEENELSQPRERRILLAAGRRIHFMNASDGNSAITSNSSSSAESWGNDPQIWTNPTQLTASSSTWSVKNTNRLSKPSFVDPWAKQSSHDGQSNPRRSRTQSWQPSSANSRLQETNSNGDAKRWSSRSQPSNHAANSKPPFVFATKNRGPSIVKLKIETKDAGNQLLSVHEVIFIKLVR
jgi:hypothetical protein